MSSEFYIACLDDLNPVELVRFSESALQFMSESPQIHRDMLSAALMRTVERRRQDAIDSGDIVSFFTYHNVGRFVVRNIDRYGNGPNFGALPEFPKG